MWQDHIATAKTVSSPLVKFGAIFDRLVAAHEHRRAPGPTDKLTVLYLEVCAFLTDELGVRLLEHCIRDHVCVPENPLWLVNLNKLVRAFIYQRESLSTGLKAAPRSLAASVSRLRPSRPPCPRTRAMVTQLVADTYASVRDLDEWREPLLEEILLPLLEKLLSSETDPAVAGPGIQILREVTNDELINSLVDDTEPVAHDGVDLFDRLHHLAYDIASSVTKPEGVPVGTSPKAVRTAPRHERSAHQAVLCMIGMFNDALETASRYAACKCINLFRDLLSLLSPHTHANVSQNLNDLGHDLTPLTDPLPTPTRLVILQWAMRLRADQEHRVQFIRDSDVSGLATIFQRVGVAATAAYGPNGSVASPAPPRSARAVS